MLRLLPLNHFIEIIMKLEQFATMRGMQWAHVSTNQAVLDYLLKDPENASSIQNLLSKRIQFDTTPDLHAALESVCSLLECSKREFLQMAVSESVGRAEAIFAAAYEAVAGEPLGERQE